MNGHACDESCPRDSCSELIQSLRAEIAAWEIAADRTQQVYGGCFRPSSPAEAVERPCSCPPANESGEGTPCDVCVPPEAFERPCPHSTCTLMHDSGGRHRKIVPDSSAGGAV